MFCIFYGYSLLPHSLTLTDVKRQSNETRYLEFNYGFLCLNVDGNVLDNEIISSCRFYVEMLNICILKPLGKMWIKLFLPAKVWQYKINDFVPWWAPPGGWVLPERTAAPAPRPESHEEVGPWSQSESGHWCLQRKRIILLDSHIHQRVI